MSVSMPISRPRSRWHSGAALATVGGVLGGLLLAAPAHADVEYGSVRWGASSYNSGTPTTGTCAATNPATPASKSFKGDNVAVTQSANGVSSIKWSGNANDVISAKHSGSITARSTPITAAGGRVTISGSAAVSGAPKVAASKCQAYSSTYVSADADIVLPAGMWLTLNGTANSVGRGEIEVEVYAASSSSASNRFSVGGLKASGAAAAYLPAGKYYLYSSIRAYGNSPSAGSATQAAFAGSVSAAATVTFTPGGAASPVTGKGASYVSLGGRSCASNAVAAAVTKKARKKAKKVVIKVNGATKVSLKGKRLKKAGALTLRSVSPTANVAVVATITTKKGKKVTVARSYRACRRGSMSRGRG